MSIIVLGMEMMDCCEKCPFLDYEQGYCFASGKKQKDGWYDCNLYVSDNKKRHKDCPLRPLPEKHGRLIDADAMERVMSETVQGDIRGYPYSDTQWEMAFRWIDHQPTIVEAEGE